MGYAILLILIMLLHPRYGIHINVWVLLDLLCFNSLRTLLSLLHFTSLSFTTLLSFTSLLLSPFSGLPLFLVSLTAGYPSEAFVRSETVFLALGNAVPEGKAAYVLIR
jgi:hypothetical protein